MFERPWPPQAKASRLTKVTTERSSHAGGSIDPIGNGELSADVMQQVNEAIGQPAGIILWETKRTKAWSDGCLANLRDDQRRSSADVALIVSQALPRHVEPRHVEQFDLVEGVWVAHPRCALPVAVALRQGLIDVSSSRLAQQGQQTKIEQVYHDLIGTKFRQRVDAVVEKFNDMLDDLDKERKFMGRQWAKRETHSRTTSHASTNRSEVDGT
jgi:hypothetical protein